MRLTWSRPEDLLPHALVQAAAEGVGVEDVAQRWTAAGGPLEPEVSGASEDAALAALRPLAAELLDEIDRRTAPAPDIPSSASDDRTAGGRVDFQRVLGGWLGRAAGCLLGKPVEKIPREGIRAIAEATGNWPVRGYFTEVGLPAGIAEQWPWNRRSRPTSLVENIAGMPEDDDLNFAMLALALLEKETLDHLELAEIFKDVQKLPPRPQWLSSQERPVSSLPPSTDAPPRAAANSSSSASACAFHPAIAALLCSLTA